MGEEERIFKYIYIYACVICFTGAMLTRESIHYSEPRPKRKESD